MKALIAFACSAVLVSTAPAETFSLKDTATGKTHGPFHYQNGENIDIEDSHLRLVQIDSRNNAILAATQTLMIPKLDFRDADIKDVVLFLTEVGRRTGNDNLDILLSHDADQTKHVTLSIRDMSLHDALCHTTEMTGNRWTVLHGAIIIEACETFAMPSKLPPTAGDHEGLFSLKTGDTGKTYGLFQLKNHAFVQMDDTILEVLLDASQETVVAKLKAMRIPTLDFRDASPQDVLLFLNATLARLRDNPAPELRIILGNGASQSQCRVTCSIRNKSLYDTLGMICDAAWLSWSIVDGNVMLEPGSL